MLALRLAGCRKEAGRSLSVFEEIRMWTFERRVRV
jgi:hypothetical protein